MSLLSSTLAVVLIAVAGSLYLEGPRDSRSPGGERMIRRPRALPVGLLISVTGGLLALILGGHTDTTSVFIHAALACTLCAWSAGIRERGGLDPLLFLGLLLSPKVEQGEAARPRVRSQPERARSKATTTRTRSAPARPAAVGEKAPAPGRQAA